MTNYEHVDRRGKNRAAGGDLSEALKRLPGEELSVSVETSGDTAAMLANPKFRKLVRTRAALGWTLTAIMLITYFGFILLVAFNKSDGAILSQKVGGGTTTLAIVVGMGLLLFTFVLTAFYVVIANASFDKLIRQIRAEVGK